MNTLNTATEAPRAPVKAMWITLILAWVLFLIPIPGTGLFVGWPLNLVAFIIAIVVMTRGRVAQGLIGLISSLVVSPLVYFGAIILMGALLGAGPYEEYKAQMEQAAAGIEADAANDADLQALLTELEAATNEADVQEHDAADEADAAASDAAADPAH